MDVLRCVFCSGKKQLIVKFNDNSLKKCENVLECRKKHNLVQNEVILPEKVNEFQGYHGDCYRRFTALKSKYKTTEDVTAEIFEPSTSQDESMEVSSGSTEASSVQPSTSGGGVVAPAAVADEIETLSLVETEDRASPTPDKCCLFCNKERKRIKGRWFNVISTENEDTIQNINQDAVELDDVENLQKIEILRAIGKNIFYHNYCRNNYMSKRRSVHLSKLEKTDWHIRRDLYSVAYNQVCEFVTENVLTGERAVFVDLLHMLYKNSLEDQLRKSDEYMQVSLNNRFLENKLLTTFKDQITIVAVGNKRIVKPLNSALLLEENIEKMEAENVVIKAALILRNEIQSIKTTKLKDTITANDIIVGECNVPPILTNFYSTVLKDPMSRRQISANTVRLVNSFSQDLIYGTSKGNIKTSKHMTLGLALKGLTNSKKVINILNGYGHCSSYTTLAELETEATYTSTSRSDICPEDIVRKPNLCTGLAFNNFDRFVDTLDGKDTLHDTVGIIFQNIDDNSATTEETESVTHSVPASESTRKRRRTYDAISYELIEYTKKPRINEHLLPNDDAARSVTAKNYEVWQKIYLLWMTSHYLDIPETPMWVGFNSLLYKDISPMQIISYLTTINSSPTNVAVIRETMQQSLKVVNECGSLYMQVTYDLAIAKVALQIQSSDRPTFDKLFIHLGMFHVMMAYFKAIGKFIDNCGISNVMTDSGLLASGSVNSFIAGKHFNRCRRLYPLLALAFQILHFESFLKKTRLEISDNVKRYLIEFKQSPKDNVSIENETLLELLAAYQKYEEKTLQGKYGKTPQFYMIFVQFVKNYLILNSSIRTADLELLTFVLPEIANLFLIFNQQNYSRYLIKYHDNLLNIDNTHPGLRLDLEKGSFGIKRTKKPYSRQPIDLTLEQTINADASNKLTGVSHMTNSLAARQRWCKSHSIQTKIISYVMEESGVQKSQDVTNDLKQSVMRKSAEQLDAFLTSIRENVNPFSRELDEDNLYNISSGAAVTDEVANFLLNVPKLGEKQRRKFIDECAADKNRFESPISRNKILSFNDALKKKTISIGNKTVQVKMERDLFGRLLLISLNKTLALDKVLTYPLTPMPLSMCHFEGTIRKTSKSVLINTLKKEIINELPTSTDIIVLDGFFMLNLMKDVPNTFGKICNKFLQMVTNHDAATVVIVFEKHVSPSIKDQDQHLIGTNLRFVIKGPDQTRPANFAAEMKNIHFKDSFVKFLINNWHNRYYLPFFTNKTVYIDYIQCYKYKVVDEQIEKTIEENLTCPNQENTGNKIVFQISKIISDCNISIRSPDTDILVILLGNMEHFNKNLHINLHIGIGNNQMHIKVNELYNNLGADLSKALTAFHAFTGCDFNPSFYGKGKTRPFNLLRKSEKYITAFKALSSYPNCDVAVFDVIEEFVCRMYNFAKINKINLARVAAFEKAYNISTNVKLTESNLKNFDASSLPPCQAELQQHIRRTGYISKMWTNAVSLQTMDVQFADCGWKVKENNEVEFLWFEGHQLPESVDEITSSSSELEDYDAVAVEEDDIEYSSTDDEETLSEDSDSE